MPKTFDEDGTIREVPLDTIRAGLWGVALGDACGVPFEFEPRPPFSPCRDFGDDGARSHFRGVWSDDTALTLSLADSLAGGLDLNDVIRRFQGWLKDGAYTSDGDVFDVGITTARAINRFAAGARPLECGGRSFDENGNGSLMRILTLLFYLQSNNIAVCSARGLRIVSAVSSLTHAHPISCLGCVLYLAVAEMLLVSGQGLEGPDLREAVAAAIQQALDVCKDVPPLDEACTYYKRLAEPTFADASEDSIGSGGYVVDTLHAALWCLLGTDSYRACILKAVNLGHDTDTTAAVTGGLAALRYGFAPDRGIPAAWQAKLVGADRIEEIAQHLHDGLRIQRTIAQGFGDI